MTLATANLILEQSDITVVPGPTVRFQVGQYVATADQWDESMSGALAEHLFLHGLALAEDVDETLEAMLVVSESDPS